MNAKTSLLNNRTADPYVDRRSGEDRRVVYDSDYFETGGMERRQAADRRKQNGRPDSCIRVSKWSSVCPDEI